MTSTLHFCLLLLLALVCSPLGASAQLTPCTGGAGGLNATLLTIDGETRSLDDIEVGADECEADVELEFEITNIAAQTLFLATGTECNTGARRDGSDDGGTDCKEVGEASEVDGLMVATVTLRAESHLGCGRDASELWFLAGTNFSDTEVTFACLQLPFDTTAPLAPEGLKDRSGERTVPLNWDPANNSTGYFVVWEAAEVADGGIDCGGEPSFGAGDELTYADLDSRADATSTNNTSLDLSRTKAGADAVWVAVAAADDAKNVSPLSEPVCVRYVEAYTFPERFEQLGGDFKDGCQTLPGAPAGRGSAAWLLAAAGALILVRRRRV